MSQETSRRLRSHSNKSDNTSPTREADIKASRSNSSSKKKRKAKNHIGEQIHLLVAEGSETEIEQFERNMGNPDPDPKTSISTQTDQPQGDKWMEMFNKLNETLQTLQEQIGELNSFKGKLNCFSSSWKEQVDKSVTDTQSKQDEHDFKIRMLTNIIIRQEEKIDMLERRVTSAYKREIKNNMIIHGIVLDENDPSREQLVTQAKSFFMEQMEIENTIEISDARLIGLGNNKPLLITLVNIEDKGIIFSNVSNLKGKKNVRKKLYFIQDDMTDEDAEGRKVYLTLLKENKQRETPLDIKMNHGKIIVNNTVIKPRIIPPTAKDTLQLSSQELEQIQAVKLIKGSEHTEKGSDFFVYVTKVKKLEDINRVYLKMRIKYGDATHISCAYRLDKPNGPFNQQSVDDTDYGCARALLDVMKDKEIDQLALFLVRCYGGVQLGSRSFEIFTQMAERGIHTWNKQNAKIKARLTRVNSQSSLTSLASHLSETEQDEDTPE